MEDKYKIREVFQKFYLSYRELHTVAFPAQMLKKGSNTIEITYPKGRRHGKGGIIWDCLKLEIE